MDDLQYICRICLNNILEKQLSSTSLDDIVSVTVSYISENEKLSDVIFYALGIKMHMYYGTSNAICDNCLLNVRGSYSLKKICEKAQATFENCSLLDDDPLDLDSKQHIQLIEVQPDNTIFQVEVQDEQEPIDEISNCTIENTIDGVLKQNWKSIIAVEEEESIEDFDEDSSPESDTESFNLHECAPVLNQAIPTNNNDALELCFICGKTLMNLANHMRVHTSDADRKRKSHKCDLCESAFVSKGLLTRHVKVVHCKKYVCDLCTKKFGTAYYLRVHMRQHTGDSPYKCDLCGSGFKQNVYLRRHIATVHQAPE